MTGSMTSVTERFTRTALALALLAAGGLAPAVAATSSDLEKILERAEGAARKAADAVGGRDPGRVSRFLQRVDQELERFTDVSRLEALQAALATARREAEAGRLDGAGEAVREARQILPILSDYTVTRQAEVGGRLALLAAGRKDDGAFLEALDTLEAAILPATLLAHLRGAREATTRGRKAMARRDAKGGAAAIADLQGFLQGLRYAGALSRALFALRVGSELLREDALLAAKDQIRRSLGDLKLAIATAPESQRGALEEVRRRTFDVWKRMTRPEEEDAGRLQTLGEDLAAIRARQV